MVETFSETIIFFTGYIKQIYKFKTRKNRQYNGMHNSTDYEEK
jgi:hypothetical protein